MADAPYPRADPAEADYLPADVWDAAQLPVGVRLEMVGESRTIRVWYKTTRASLGYRGESAGCRFVAYRAGQKVAEADAVMGEGMAELVLSGRTDLPVTIYFPEGMKPIISGVMGIEETMAPAPLQPRWLAYGDAVTQGWLASAPAMAWPAVAGRKLGLDVCNFGYAGTARPETTSALMLAETPAEVISIAFGLNNWSRVPHTVGLMAEEVRCFLSVVREGHPDLPIVVVSPTTRPDAEDVPNRVGATLSELRGAMEQAVLDVVSGGDEKLFLVSGLAVVDPEDLEDGIYPGDEGHRRIAAAVSKILVPHLGVLQRSAEKRWAEEGTSPTADSVPSAITDAPDSTWTTLDDVIFTDPPDVPSPNGRAEIPAPVDTAPVDRADGMFGGAAEEFGWADSYETESLQWTDPEETESLQWIEPVPTDSLQWTDPVETESLQWTESVAAESVPWDRAGAESLEEFQWTEPVPTEELQRTEPASVESLQWDDQGPAESLEWTEPVAAESLEWSGSESVEELEWSGAAEPGLA